MKIRVFWNAMPR